MIRCLAARITAFLLVTTILSLNTLTTMVSALSPAQLRAMQSGAEWVDVDAPTCTPTTSSGTVTSGSVYVVGDSITVGATPALQTAAGTTGVSFIKINGVVGRSVTGGGQGNESGLQAVQNDASSIAAANIVVVALGTNGGSEADITNMITAIRTANTANPTIYWVNIFSPEAAGNREAFNQSLNTLSTSLSFKVIDTTNKSITTTDGLHPNTDGQKIFAETITSVISGRSTAITSASGCSCSVSGPTGNGGDRDARYRAVWAYLTSNKGLSEEATAGLMGNLEAESGINPHNTQDNAPAPDGPEIPIDAIENRFGYGIAQWTTSGRQRNLIAYAQETNRSTGDLGLQLDFLWKELNESFTGVLTVLQTPNVSIAEASYEVLSRFEVPRPFTDAGTQAERDATTATRLRMSQAIFDEFSGQSIPSTLGGGCGSNGAPIDLESPDTSHIPCGGGTSDAGVFEGFRKGKQYNIRLCHVGNTRVNSQISEAMERLLADSAEAGIKITFGSFRSMEEQIGMYTSRCREQGLEPTEGPYPKPSYSDYQACDSIAPPGYSNHQMGLAIDVSCDGVLIPRYQPAAGDNPCFQWLVANGAKYSLYEFGKGEGNRTTGSYEAWHWSVDGD